MNKEIEKEVKKSLSKIADLVKLLEEKECNDVTEIKTLYLSLFALLIECGYDAIIQEDRVDIDVYNNIYSAHLATLEAFLQEEYQPFLERIEKNAEIKKELLRKLAEPESDSVPTPDVEVQIESETTSDMTSTENAEDATESTEETAKESIEEEPEAKLDPKPDIREEVVILTEKIVEECLAKNPLPPQLMRENYKKCEESDSFHKSNFIFNVHDIICKESEGSLVKDKYKVFIFPTEYCNNGSASKILTAVISEDDRIHYATSQIGKKSVIIDMDDYRFILSGKWNAGLFKTNIIPYAYDGKDFVITSDVVTELNHNIYTEEFGMPKTIDGYTYHFFPLALVNDESCGTCSFMIFDKQTKEIRISNNTKEMMLVASGMAQNYHTFWTGDLFNIEQI